MRTKRNQRLQPTHFATYAIGICEIFPAGNCRSSFTFKSSSRTSNRRTAISLSRFSSSCFSSIFSWRSRWLASAMSPWLATASLAAKLLITGTRLSRFASSTCPWGYGVLLGGVAAVLNFLDDKSFDSEEREAVESEWKLSHGLTTPGWTNR